MTVTYSSNHAPTGRSSWSFPVTTPSNLFTITGKLTYISPSQKAHATVYLCKMIAFLKTGGDPVHVRFYCSEQAFHDAYLNGNVTPGIEITASGTLSSINGPTQYTDGMIRLNLSDVHVTGDEIILD